MKIVLYGIGKSEEILEKKLKKEHEIVGYSDSISKISLYKGKPFYTDDELERLKFDFLIITNKDGKTASLLQECLSKKHPYLAKKIIPFYLYANTELYKGVLNKVKEDTVHRGGGRGDSSRKFSCQKRYID